MAKPKKTKAAGAADEIKLYMDVADIAHAPWNPRSREELDWKHPAMVELIDSISSLGVLQPIAVWVDGKAAKFADDGRKVLCIAGNRRLEAARAVGLKTIPVHQFTNLTEEGARADRIRDPEERGGNVHHPGSAGGSKSTTQTDPDDIAHHDLRYDSSYVRKRSRSQRQHLHRSGYRRWHACGYPRIDHRSSGTLHRIQEHRGEDNA